MAVIGVILLAAALLAVRGRLIRLALHRGGEDPSGQSGEDTCDQHGCSAK